MKKVSLRYRKFNKHKSEKIMRLLSKIKREKIKGDLLKKRKIISEFELPSDFRLFENYDIVMNFFHNVLKEIKMKLSLHTDIKTLSVKFKLKNIERATNESIMFLLAIVNSYKNESIKNIHYSGDVPIKESVKRMFIESGFLNYCRTNNMGNLQTSENKIQIKYGNGYYKPNDFISVYDWISRDINVAKHYTKDLSGIINEIIGNAVEHAYPKSNNNFKQKNWYFYAEKKEKHIEFIALDPGVGMPQTMKKNFFEKIFQWALNTDAKLIESALLGIFRTKTEERNRGNGLPKIYNSVVKGKISNLQILSQKGYCFIEKNGNIFTENKHKGFPGTLYKWELKVEE